MKNKHLAEEIVQMAKLDQKIRKEYTKKPSLYSKLKTIDKSNLIKMKGIVKKFNWPGVDLVGKKASHLAWLLVQHADSDVDFQEYCLKLMINAAKKNDVPKPNIAFLTDRILVNKGKSQLYGTQFYKDKTGTLIPRPIQDVKNLNKRRKNMDLEDYNHYQNKVITIK